MEDVFAALGTMALVVALFFGLGWLVFGSLPGLWQAIVICFTEDTP